MLVKIESLDQFMKLLELMKPSIVFLKKNKELSKENIISGYLSLQFEYGTDIVTYLFDAGIEPLQVPPKEFIGMVAFYMNEDAAKRVSTMLSERLGMLDKQLDEQYQKAYQVITGKMYTVIEGVLQ